MSTLESQLSPYHYSYPADLIAQQPAHPREAARLLVYSRASGEIVHTAFRHLPEYLPRNAVLVFNQSKVLPARLHLAKTTGGKVDVLYISGDEQYMKVLANRELQEGSWLLLSPRKKFVVEKLDGQYYYVRPQFSIHNIYSFLLQHGHTPIPPYIKHTSLTERKLRAEYQAVFAKKRGSVAAPTASLHFSNRLLAAIKRQGCAVKFVTLHVGLGTFAPLKEEHLQQGKLHQESFVINPVTASFLNTAKREGRPIVAVGTTVVRTLESAANERGMLTRLSGQTDLFIREGYKFKFVDSLITNFHVPKSSLLMLVSAFASRKEVMRLYEVAVEDRYRLFSFGDGMLIV